ncbi:MAG: hypothetical protein AAGI69_19965 [Cyanobacteria bacterium P01_H01_bin.21]
MALSVVQQSIAFKSSKRGGKTGDILAGLDIQPEQNAGLAARGCRAFA